MCYEEPRTQLLKNLKELIAGSFAKAIEVKQGISIKTDQATPIGIQPLFLSRRIITREEVPRLVAMQHLNSFTVCINQLHDLSIRAG